MATRSIQADKQASRGEDQMGSLGDTNLADHYKAPEPEYAASVPSGMDSTYDESPLVMGDDGDDAGARTKVKFRVDGNGDPDRTLAAMAPGDMLASGHGYMVRDLGEAPTTEWRQTCEVCGEHLPPGSVLCNCNWCLHYQMWLRGEYRPRGGRPAKRCGTKECSRMAARDRKRLQRERERAVRDGVSQKPPN